MNQKHSLKIWGALALATFFAIASSVIISCQKSVAKDATPQSVSNLPVLPTHLPVPFHEPMIYKTSGSQSRELTIIPEIQEQLEVYIRERGSPIAAVIMVEVATGNILAMAQGKAPELWGAETHTALHQGFPAASLFKTVTTAAAFEIANADAQLPVGLTGGCSHVTPTGIWMRRDLPARRNPMTLERAYGHSCNGFFAKVAINQVGLGGIVAMARRFGWDGSFIPADFRIPASPFNYPDAASSSAYSVGRFAAGFGHVGVSAAHVAWQTLAIANDGEAKPLRIFKDSRSSTLFDVSASRRIIASETALKIRGVMGATTNKGTASFAFRRGKYKVLKGDVGGKTGTLTGNSPEGLTTWFTGMMPLDKPEVVVASVVILEDLWKFKSPNLSAEAFSAYHDYKKRAMATAQPVTPASNIKTLSTHNP